MDTSDLTMPLSTDSTAREASSVEKRERWIRLIQLLLAALLILTAIVLLWWMITRGIPRGQSPDYRGLFAKLWYWITLPFGHVTSVDDDFGLSAMTIVVSLVTFIAGVALNDIEGGGVKFGNHRDGEECAACGRGQKNVDESNIVMVDVCQYVLAFTLWISLLCMWFLLGTHKEIGAIAYLVLMVISGVLLWNSLAVESFRGVSYAANCVNWTKWKKRTTAVLKITEKKGEVSLEYEKQLKRFWRCAVFSILLCLVASFLYMWLNLSDGAEYRREYIIYGVMVVIVIECAFVVVLANAIMLDTKVERFVSKLLTALVLLMNLSFILSYFLLNVHKTDHYSWLGVIVILQFVVFVVLPMTLFYGLCGKGPWKDAASSIYWNLRPYMDRKGRDRIALMCEDKEFEKARKSGAGVFVANRGAREDESASLNVCCKYLDESEGNWYYVTPKDSASSEEWVREKVSETGEDLHSRQCNGFDICQWRGKHIGPPVHPGTAFEIVLCEDGLEWERGCWNVGTDCEGRSKVKRVLALPGSQAQIQLRVYDKRTS